MSLLHIESADLSDTFLQGSKWTFIDLANVSQATEDGRLCWLLVNRSSQRLGKMFAVADRDPTVVIGWRSRVSGGGSDSGDNTQNRLAAVVGDGVDHIEIVQRGSNRIGFRHVGLGTEWLSAPDKFFGLVWHYVEAKVTISDTVGALELRVDGEAVVTQAGIDTRNAGASADVFGVQIGAHRNITHWVRDIVLMNSAGAVFNDFKGPCQAKAVRPDGAGGYTQWTPNAGANWAAVDEEPPDSDTTYVESDTAGERDAYTFADLPVGMDGIEAVQAYAIGRYETAPLDIGTFLRRGGVDDDGPLDTPAGTYQARGVTIWESDPIAAGPWTLANFNLTEFGIRSA